MYSLYMHGISVHISTHNITGPGIFGKSGEREIERGKEGGFENLQVMLERSTWTPAKN